ncbi:MAG: alpha/beta hydrolase family protein [Thermoleophilaceae bacterium]
MTVPQIGEHDGLAYALFLPEAQAETGVLILHGAGSAKESHFDFARMAVANGIAALAYDARGHNRSDGAFGPGAIDDVKAMLDLLRELAGVRRVAVRGSSMGGFQAILGAARDGEVDAVVAICPAPPDLLLHGVRSGRLEGFEADREALLRWLPTVDLNDAAASLGPRTALMLLHAQGDEQVPYTVSEELYEVAARPKRLLILPGGHHRSLQHDLEIQGESLKFIERAAR